MYGCCCYYCCVCRASKEMEFSSQLIVESRGQIWSHKYLQFLVSKGRSRNQRSPYIGFSSTCDWAIGGSYFSAPDFSNCPFSWAWYVPSRWGATPPVLSLTRSCAFPWRAGISDLGEVLRRMSCLFKVTLPSAPISKECDCKYYPWWAVYVCYSNNIRIKTSGGKPPRTILQSGAAVRRRRDLRTKGAQMSVALGTLSFASTLQMQNDRQHPCPVDKRCRGCAHLGVWVDKIWELWRNSSKGPSLVIASSSKMSTRLYSYLRKHIFCVTGEYYNTSLQYGIQ